MSKNPFIRVRAAKFAIMEGEDGELVNEGMYGKAFSLYLQSQLASRNYPIPFVVCEDWGWWVEIGGQPYTFGLCVYGQQIDETKELDLCVTVQPSTGRMWSWRRFRFVDTTPEVQRLYDDLRDLLRSDSEVTVLGESDGFPLDS